MTISISTPTSNTGSIQNNSTDVLTIGSDNSVSIDTNTLHVDATNNHVGIGTSSPMNKLDVTDSDKSIQLIPSFIGTNDEPAVFAFDKNTFGMSSVNMVGSDFKVNVGPNLIDIGEVMRIDSAGRVTMTNQPSFKAFQSANGQINVNNVQLVFDDVTTRGGHNIGNHYNTSTGVFTAPISGRYLFSAAMLTNAGNMGNGAVNIQWRINGADVHYFAHGHLSSWIMESGTVIFNLSANDTVNLYLYTGSGHYGTYSHFSGCLLG